MLPKIALDVIIE